MTVSTGKASNLHSASATSITEKTKLNKWDHHQTHSAWLQTPSNNGIYFWAVSELVIVKKVIDREIYK